jgi:plastocyanin
MNGRIKMHAQARCVLLTAATLSAVLSATACSDSHTGSPAVGNKAVVTAAAAHPTPRNSPAATSNIAIKDFVFQPATLSVAVGSKVVWTNRDEEPHRVVSADGQFHPSPALDTDDSYAAVFAKPGTYSYFCSIHPHMVGKIIVK